MGGKRNVAHPINILLGLLRPLEPNRRVTALKRVQVDMEAYPRTNEILF